MNSEITIKDFSPHLYGDVHLAAFDLEKHNVHMIQKVLEYGRMSDWNLLKSFYGLDKIKEVSLNLRSLDAVTLSFLSTIFNSDKTEFRCYIHRQLLQNYLNS
ncbi:hypothetical protein ASG31_09200 [Chryseobacterium sp. Leaf404]|uniref:DUF6922 domain-containing protein n=1 Tax=unclassified Chryseobacterium TaxID=2593645 RepID=UPI0006FC5F65|nr:MULTISPECIES: hypothetical protein [unclassified Chryseobacterium]KQT17567.1 hypothetical protein ASG31_09200 [Chryseobacterium sp. Leaf404]